ncbi:MULTISPECIES: alpha-L-fucosidase [unclassified Arcicella]|uniref:alpha-L-fucosidase n=1 Tax=unclassified Arcicella TaxID=2644986 RepID=UPI00285F2536|nr:MULTISPECIES: alpha-L-fucosidase [unclassified Arcicella]MDR6564842.1 alpha-L-fucosidase [Arcicella sp. BE51]MDR6826041.1 alpha-L-fucosidase [Arcicella sp. BE139]
MFLKKIVIFLICICFTIQIQAQKVQVNNKPERINWFQDLAFGMFIHWNVDVSLGAVISHSLAGASNEYVEKYINELPKYFNPNKFNPTDWAKSAKLAGMKYVVFTAKHHSGFCMFNTQTTPFNVMNTPYGKDLTKEIIDAFRKEGIAIGIYFSPEDFNYFHKNNIQIGRLQLPEHFPANNKGLMDYDKKQLKELLTNYGKVDILFIDGPGDGLREYAWSLNPELVITRDIMTTPEQNTPDEPMARPWEACYTMGTDWQYKPTNDPHKSGTEIINMLVEIRAKGGNFLLNVGPKQDGELQIEQQALLQEIALWNFANAEAIHAVKPLSVVREDNIWYTQSNDEKYIYAIVQRSGFEDWRYGTRKNFVLTHIEGNANTKVSILGYKSELVEYKKDFDAKIYNAPTTIGLVVSAVNGQRFYTNNQWKNAVVLKIENAKFRKLNTPKATQSSIDGAK